LSVDIKAISWLSLSHNLPMTLLPEPPTSSTLASARTSLATHIAALSNLSTKIASAESALAQIIAESKCAIAQLQKEKEEVEKKVEHLQAYVAPIRRLPEELVREVFGWAFKAHPCAAWVMSAVCVNWRRLAIGTPVLWSKVGISFRI
jgi:F-box-like